MGAVFDQSHQTVGFQYNAAGDINFGSVKNRADLIAQLEKLSAEVKRAKGSVDEKQRAKVERHLEKATSEASHGGGGKKSIITHLETAQTAIKGVKAFGGMVSALVEAVNLAKEYF